MYIRGACTNHIHSIRMHTEPVCTLYKHDIRCLYGNPMLIYGLYADSTYAYRVNWEPYAPCTSMT